jgi:microcompartment protein CcmL/EutN
VDAPLDIEALALLEIDGMPRALLAQDAALKRAPVHVLACAPTSPGKALLLLHGDVAAAEEASRSARAVASSRLIDSLWLPGVHARVVAALQGYRRPAAAREGLAVLEFATVCATLLAMDAAVKCAEVAVGRVHLASGYGGKGFFTLRGSQADLEAAADAASAIVGARLLDCEVLPAPHDELEDAAFVRPWGLDPAAE